MELCAARCRRCPRVRHSSKKLEKAGSITDYYLAMQKLSGGQISPPATWLCVTQIFRLSFIILLLNMRQQDLLWICRSFQHCSFSTSFCDVRVMPSITLPRKDLLTSPGFLLDLLSRITEACLKLRSFKSYIHANTVTIKHSKKDGTQSIRIIVYKHFFCKNLKDLDLASIYLCFLVSRKSS